MNQAKSMIGLGLLILTICVSAAVLVDRRLGAALVDADDATSTGRPTPPSSSGSPVFRAFAGARTTPVSGVIFGLPFFVAGLLLLVLGQIGLIGGDPSLFFLLLWFTGLACFVLLELQGRSTTVPSHRSASREIASLRTVRWRLLLLLPVLLASVFIIDEAPSRAIDDSSLDIVLLWILSIVALVVASGALPERISISRIIDLIRNSKPDLILLAVLFQVALVPRAYSLSSYAWSMSGDEGTFGVTARSTLEGTMRNPFSSGPWGYPSLLFIVQGWFVDVFGGSVGSARALSAMFGIASVLTVWLLVRDHFGPWVAFLAGILCAALSFHVYWSRDAQDASAPMFFLPLAILFLDRGLVGGSRANSVAAGLTIALAQFFHPANRLLLPMAVAYFIYALLLRTRDDREISWRTWGPTLSNTGWLAAAVVIGHLPLIAYFEAHRVEFWWRTNEVSVFASGWLDREQDITGDSAIVIMARQIWNAIMLPFSSIPHGHFRPGSPLVGWPLVIFVAVGFALVTIWALSRQYFGVALGFWVVTIGLGFTDGPPMTNRYTAAAPFLAILGAIGIWALATQTIRLAKLHRDVLLPLAGGITLLIAIWHFHFYFQDPNQVELYSDSNSQIANGVAREAETLGEEATVYLAGLPRLLYYGFQNIQFIAPDATGIDVDPVWNASQEPPVLTGPTLFAFIPERLTELDVIRSWFPNGTQREHFLPDGSFLYTSYLVDSDDRQFPG